jgi:hypothetical protein
LVGGAQLKEAHAKEQEAHEELQRTSAEAEERAEADAAAYIAVLRQEAHDAHDAVERLTADLTATKVGPRCAPPHAVGPSARPPRREYSSTPSSTRPPRRLCRGLARRPSLQRRRPWRRWQVALEDAERARAAVEKGLDDRLADMVRSRCAVAATVAAAAPWPLPALWAAVVGWRRALRPRQQNESHPPLLPGAQQPRVASARVPHCGTPGRAGPGRAGGRARQSQRASVRVCDAAQCHAHMRLQRADHAIAEKKLTKQIQARQTPHSLSEQTDRSARVEPLSDAA